MEAIQKPWKGIGMNGWVARWYTRTRQNDTEDFRRAAKTVAARLRPGSCVLEVAPGPGFFAIELSKLGNFQITGLDISRTFVEIATGNARNAGVNVDFRWGNASAMPFADASFDFVYCSAAFKNFSEPIRALNEIYRILRPAGEALIEDLSKDASVDEIDEYVRRSGRSGLDAWMTKWIFRHVLLKRAYTRNDFVRMVKESSFGSADIRSCDLGLEVWATKAARSAEGVA
jgi:ubiquinone/menaquinone biosynthesis C-methylase UbiE